jgi:hypothetical protein
VDHWRGRLPFFPQLASSWKAYRGAAIIGFALMASNPVRSRGREQRRHVVHARLTRDSFKTSATRSAHGGEGDFTPVMV